MKKYIKICVVLVLIYSLIGCQYSGEKNNVEIIISKDFGTEVLSQKHLEIEEGYTVLDLMEENYEVETAYGGSFINGINGIVSQYTNQKKKQKVDWFYYVNGTLSQIGSGDFELKANDVVIWDYHTWDQSAYMSSIIGAYPQNFIHNYYGEALRLNILYADDYKEKASNIRDYLETMGVSVSVSQIQEALLEDELTNTIVIGSWDTLSKYRYIDELYEHKDKTGLFFQIDNDIKGLSSHGEISRTFKKGAVMAATLKGYEKMAALWMITGNDEKLIKECAQHLYEDPDQIKGIFSLLVTENGQIELPISK